MFPSSGGQYTQNTDFGLTSSVMQFIEEGRIKLYNVETLDMLSFYHDHMITEEKIHNYELYMQFLRNELIPYIQNECNIHRTAVAGVSFGGFHAANTAFRFPDLVSHFIGMSAAFSIRSMAQLSDDKRIYFNCPEEFMQHEEEWKYNHMQIVLGTSDWDICRDKNLHMSGISERQGHRPLVRRKKMDAPRLAALENDFSGVCR